MRRTRGGAFHADGLPASMKVRRGGRLQVAVIVNPAAGGGRMGRIWPAAEAVLSRRFASIAVAITQGPGDGRRLAAEFTRQGMELIVAAGGDGTASEVADGMLTAAARARAPDLALLPVGTGSDLAHSLGIGRDFADAMKPSRPARRASWMRHRSLTGWRTARKNDATSSTSRASAYRPTSRVR
jgi:hypothetical protein